MLQSGADEKNVVCKSEVGKVRAEVVFGKSDSVLTFLTLSCLWFHDVLHE